MRIQIGGLSEGAHEYHFHESASSLGLNEEFHGDLHVDATLEKSGTQMFLRARISTTAEFQCDRCLAPFSEQVAVAYRMVYVMNGAETGNMDPSEIQRIAPGVNIIDITEDVRQTVLLSVPLKRLCREDCRGLCPHCGKNKNNESCTCTGAETDSRWEKLRFIQRNN